MPTISLILSIFGHGRALEANYIGLKLLIGITIFYPENIQILPIQRLQWYAPDPLIAAPFLCIAVIQFVGLWMNIRGYESSRFLRLFGAGAAIGMWMWLIVQSIHIGAIASMSFSVGVMGILSSSYLCFLAILRLPAPGPSGVYVQT